MSSKVNHGPLEGLGGEFYWWGVGLVSESASSTIGVWGGEDGEGSFDPVNGWTMRSQGVVSHKLPP